MTDIDITVVVPTYARPERLDRCLTALADTRGVAFEVVVVDDGSPEPVAPLIARHEAAGLAVRGLRQDNAGPAAARNRGVAAARASVIAFTDDDCRPRSGWLAALVSALEGRPNLLVGGRTVNGLPDDLCAETSQDLTDYLYGAGGDGPDYFATNNMACHRAAFDAVGGFDESFPLAAGEDRDFGLRWGASGRVLEIVPDAVIDHDHAMQLKGFLRQHRNYGRGARQVHGRMRERADARPRFGAAGFYAGLVTYPIRRRRPQALRRSALLLASQAATTWGYLEEALRPVPPRR